MSIQREKEISRNLERIHQNLKKHIIANQSVQLICVSKNHPLEDVLIANSLGEQHFGENRVQELLRKQSEFNALPDEVKSNHQLHWHLIGTLQRNKVKDIIGLVDLIHSVDSMKLIKQIDKISQERDVVTNILLQVNIAKEESKQGFVVSELDEIIKEAIQYKNILLKGLMVIAPFYQEEDIIKVKPIFQEAKQLLTKYQEIIGDSFNQLSMGMSNDYQYAIEEGATLIRIGTDIFGERDYSS